MTNKILVTGGAGYIGSHMCKYLYKKGYDIVVVDNLTTGHKNALKYGSFYEIDLANKQDLTALFQKHNFASIFHFAAFSLVAESMQKPAKYIRNNLANCLNLLEVALEHSCKNFIFSSTAAVYGEPETTPICENHPLNPINPYGRSKLLVEQVLCEYSKAYDFNYVALRYFNAAGADPEGELGENHEPETHLIPLICKAMTGQRGDIKINGTDYPTKDGTCIRDYIHVQDLCKAHHLALNYLENAGRSDIFNLGSGQGFSIMEILETAQNLIKDKYPNLELKISQQERRAGDPAILIADSSKAEQILGWNKQYTNPRDIIEHCLKWELRRHDNQATPNNNPIQP